MKRIIFGTIILLIGITSYYTLQQASSSRYTKVINVGVHVFPPFAIQDPETGQLSGFDIELFDAMAKARNLKFNYKVIDFNDLIPGVKTGKYDTSNAITITPEREKLLRFTWPCEEAKLALLVRTDEKNIKTLADLSDKILSSYPGTGADMCEKFKKEGKVKDYLVFDKIKDTYQALVDGKADAIINDAPVNNFFCNYFKGKLKHTDHCYTHQYSGFPVRKDNNSLRVALNKALHDIFENGDYVRIYRKYHVIKP